MELMKNVRLKIGNSILEKKLDKISRKVCYTNIDQVKKIGIVWDASYVNDFTCLSKFYQRMNERNIEVRIIGYFPGNKLPDEYTALRYMNCFRRNEVSFFYLPSSSECESFIREHFDVLIDLNFKNSLPLKYITSLSNAGLKVGLFESEKNGRNYDLMMDLSKPVNVDMYLDQVLLYLEMINSGQSEKIHKN
jgi:hypothetical protein